MPGRDGLVASYCHTAPGAGSDPVGLHTIAVRDDDHDILDGVEQFISAASTSDRYVVMARTGVAGPKGVLAFVVEKCIPGVRFGKECKVGRHGQSTAQVIFEGVRVPAETC